MCENCDGVMLKEAFRNPKEYAACLEYIQDLMSSGNFMFVEKTCDLDRTKDENGCWIDDLIQHVIQCKNCGKRFTCFADTYHGGGSFSEG